MDLNQFEPKIPYSTLNDDFGSKFVGCKKKECHVLRHDTLLQLYKHENDPDKRDKSPHKLSQTDFIFLNKMCIGHQ